jgi:hypothetical protein
MWVNLAVCSLNIFEDEKQKILVILRIIAFAACHGDVIG